MNRFGISRMTKAYVLLSYVLWPVLFWLWTARRLLRL
jgi:hypothetical protein